MIKTLTYGSGISHGRSRHNRRSRRLRSSGLRVKTLRVIGQNTRRGLRLPALPRFFWRLSLLLFFLPKGSVQIACKLRVHFKSVILFRLTKIKCYQLIQNQLIHFNTRKDNYQNSHLRFLSQRGASRSDSGTSNGRSRKVLRLRVLRNKSGLRLPTYSTSLHLEKQYDN